MAGHAAVAAAAVAKSEEAAPASRAAVVEQPAPVAESKPKEEAVLTFPAPVTEDEGEQPRGLWGGFWRRHTDD